MPPFCKVSVFVRQPKDSPNPRLAIMRWCAVVLVLASVSCWAQGSSQTAVNNTLLDIKATPEQEVMLRLENRDITMLRATVGGFSPEQRRKNILARMEQILGAKGAAPIVTRKPLAQGVAFYLDDQMVFAIAFQDLDTSIGETMKEVGDRVEPRLDLAIREIFETRSVSRLVKNALWVLLATAAFLLFVFIVHRLRYRINSALEARYKKRRLLAEGPPTVFSRFIRGTFQMVFGLAVLLVELAVANVWLTFALQRFPYTRPWGEGLSKNLITLIVRCEFVFGRALPGLATVAAIVAACYGLTQLANKLFFAIRAGDITVPGLHPEVAPPTRRLVVGFIWIFGLIMAYPHFPGSQTEAFKGVSVFLGLLVTLGSSGVFGQAMCGILLMYSRAFSRGDYIRIADTEGTVIELGTLSTKIRTIKNEVVNIPNSVVVSTQVKNFSRLQDTTGVIVHSEATIGYTAPWRQVEAMLILAAQRTYGLKQEPSPFVLQLTLGDYAVSYQINAYLERAEDRVATLASLHRSIQDVFNEHGVQIMTPHYRRDPVEPQVVPKDRWFEAPAQRAEETVPDVPPAATPRNGRLGRTTSSCQV
jgi:small-conductance mechanosensitive channel